MLYYISIDVQSLVITVQPRPWNEGKGAWIRSYWVQIVFYFFSSFSIFRCKLLFPLNVRVISSLVFTSDAISRIKIFPLSCAFAYACVCAATSEYEIPLRTNTSTRILPPVVMFGQWKHWIQISSPLKSFPKWRKFRMVLLVLVFASNFIFSWVIPTASICALRLCMCLRR